MSIIPFEAELSSLYALFNINEDRDKNGDGVIQPANRCLSHLAEVDLSM
jgi:hypothetical protein